jgi:hypothetical protein
VTLLAALLVVVAAAAVYQWWPRPSAVAAPASNGRGAGRATGRGGPSTPEAPDVHMPRLGEERPKPVAGERNLFRFKPKAAPPAPTQPLQAPQLPPQPPVAFGPPGPPPIPLRFIGFIDPGAGQPKIAALVDTTGRPFNCVEGKECDGRYHIWRVGLESVEISYLDGTGRRTIRLGGG